MDDNASEWERRPPSPLNGERAGVRGEVFVRLPISRALEPMHPPHLTLPSPLPPGAERESLRSPVVYPATRAVLERRGVGDDLRHSPIAPSTRRRRPPKAVPVRGASWPPPAAVRRPGSRAGVSAPNPSGWAAKESLASWSKPTRPCGCGQSPRPFLESGSG